MHAAQTPSASPRRRHLAAHAQAGFSLVELMVVVVIVGVLSAIAIPTFQSYLQKSRTAEATEFLGVIKLREESYRSEFGMYCRTVATANGGGVAQLTTAANLMPDPSTVVANKGAPMPFYSSTAAASDGFRDLGARPSGTVRFGYGVAAGSPAAADLPDAAFGWTAANADFWFIARAVADLDRDGNYVTFETYSASRNIWVGVGTTAEAKGWE